MNTDIAKILANIKSSQQGFLFYTKRNKPLNYGNVRYAFIKSAKADATNHDLQEKSLTDADSAGKDAQKLGGHSDHRMTARYLRNRKPTQACAPSLPKNCKSIRHPTEKF